MKKNKAAKDALITAGSAAIISRYRAMGNPAKVPKPLTVPAIVPTKNLDKLWLSFLFTYPFNNKLAKISTVTEIIRCIILGFKIDNNFTPKGVPTDTPNNK